MRTDRWLRALESKATQDWHVIISSYESPIDVDDFILASPGRADALGYWKH